MNHQNLINTITAHASLWQRMQPMLENRRLPQAMLFVGPRHLDLLLFANRLIALMTCQNENACGHCNPCRLICEGGHPDIHYVSPEEMDKPIKVDQIRYLQQSVYQTPQRAVYRFIVINPAERMNSSAANALLKILEEPPAHAIFILLAEQVGTIVPTILSRCQKFYASEIPGIEPISMHNCMALGELYSTDTSRAQLFLIGNKIIEEICSLIECKTTVCTLAAQWSKYSYDDLLWFLYLINAQVIAYQLSDKKDHSHPFSQSISILAAITEPFYLFYQIERICGLIKKINHNIGMNKILALEDLLLGYLGINE